MNRATKPTPRSFNDDDPLTVPTEREALDRYRRVRSNHLAACIDREDGVIICQCGVGSPNAF